LRELLLNWKKDSRKGAKGAEWRSQLLDFAVASVEIRL
jgi:hypothetical protein